MAHTGRVDSGDTSAVIVVCTIRIVPARYVCVWEGVCLLLCVLGGY
jgi:hypothetical protein